MVTDLAHALQEIVGERYRIERELPHGGMSRLFLAEEAGLPRRVVIKVLPPELACRASVERFQREVDVTAQLLHPHVVPVLSAGGRGDVLFYVTPFVDGETLRQRLVRGGPLPPAEAVRVLGEVAEAVAFAHTAGVAHRDLKPDNVFLVDGHAMLADFGIARALVTASGAGGEGGAPEGWSPAPGPAWPARASGNGRASAGVRPAEYAPPPTGSQTLLGTPGYIPPDGWASPLRGDVFALAVTGVELLTGTRGLPLRAGAGAEALALPRATPAGVAAVLARGLAADPESRYADAREFHAALAAATGRAPASSRRAVLLGVAAACLTYAAVWLWPRPQREFDHHLIAVAPFDAVAPSLALWREGMVDALSRELDGASPIRTASPSLYVRDWTGRADAASADRLARQTRARYVVLGTLTALGGDSVRLTALLYDAAERRPVHAFEQPGTTGRMAALTDSLTLALLDKLGALGIIGAVPGRPLKFAGRSLPLRNAFLAGEQFYRRNQWDSAEVYYARAVAIDSTFAPALSRMRGVLRRVSEFGDESLEYALRAGRFNRGLGERDSLLVTADSVFAAIFRLPQDSPAWWAGARRALTLFEQAARRDSTDADVWSQYAEATYHLGSFVGRPFTGALLIFRHGIAADSGFAPLYYHAIELSAWLDGREPTLRLLDKYLALNPADTGMRFVRRVVERGAPAVAGLAALPAGQLSRVEYLLHRWVDPTGASIALSRRLAGDSALAAATFRSDSLARLTLAQELLYRGRLREAAGVMTAPDLAASPALAVRLAEHGVLPGARLAELVAGWRDRRDVKALTLAAPWLAAGRDTATLAVLASSCAGAAAVRPECAYGAAAARGYLALAQGDLPLAAERLAVLPDTACPVLCGAQRVSRAELLARAGRLADAAAFLDRYPPTPRRAGLPWTGDWLLARGRVAARLGDRATAGLCARRLAVLWSGADPALRRLLSERPPTN